MIRSKDITNVEEKNSQLFTKNAIFKVVINISDTLI